MASFTRDPTLKKWQDTTTASDTFNGDTAKDFIVGRSGDDIFSGGNGNDFIMGNKGADQLFGDSGGDVLLGGRGNDLLDGDYGTDTLTGGRRRRIASSSTRAQPVWTARTAHWPMTRSPILAMAMM